MGYNLVVYPLCLAMMYWWFAPIYRTWLGLARSELADDSEIEHIRRRVLWAPFLVVLLSCFGWLPGGLIFPWALHLLAGPVSAAIFGHFLISCTLSGLIALTYSVFCRSVPGAADFLSPALG